MLSILLALAALGPLIPVGPPAPASQDVLATAFATNDPAPLGAGQGASTREGLPAGMRIIPGGLTILGSDPDEVERLGDRKLQDMTEIAAETPRHTAQVETFFMDRTEVTNLQWQVYLEAIGRAPSRDLIDFGWHGHTIPEGEEQFPVGGIGMGEIEGYLRWCGKRLPSEPEWIRAARGDDDRAYPWGPDWDPRRLQSANTIPHTTVAVGSYPQGASPFDILDLAGNVAEWVASPFTPYDGFEPVTYTLGHKRIQLIPEFNRRHVVVKGGCYSDTREKARIDSRLRFDPSYDVDTGLGFRGARSDPEGGVEALRAGYRALLPARLPDVKALDLDDIFRKAATQHDTARDVITDFRCVAFAHPRPARLESLSRLLRASVDEPIVLGLLVTTEALEQPALPPGSYLVAYKKEGRSKASKQRRARASQRDRAPGELAAAAGAPLPWPGFVVDDVVEDIDFPQNESVILYINKHDAVVGWTPAPIPQERSVTPLEVSSRDGRALRLEFSLDNARPRAPRFEVPLTLRQRW